MTSDEAPVTKGIVFAPKDANTPSKVDTGKDVIRILKKNADDANKRWASFGKDLYEDRIMGMRVQFAWAILLLIVTWLFIILFLVVTLSLKQFYSLFLYRIVAICAASLFSGIASYSICHVLAEALRYWQESVACFIRSSSQYISVLLGLATGFCIYHQFANSCIKIESVFLPFGEISDSVLIALITSTTASVLGILAGVMWWLFPRQREKQDTTNKAK